MFFLTTLDQAEEFFKRVSKLAVDNYENRLEILRQMAEERRMFKQTGEQVKSRLKGKKVLHVKRPD